MFRNYHIFRFKKISKPTFQILGFLLIFTLSFLNMNAQNVQSRSFDRMLNKLLKGDVSTINVEEADSMLNKNKAIIFLDTREKVEYDVSHIKNARWVGYDNFSIAKLKDLSKNAMIINYCSVGARSEKITRKMQAAGFKNVYNLYGSIFEWVNAGKEVVDKDNHTTQEVHAYNRLWGIWLKRGEKVYD